MTFLGRMALTVATLVGFTLVLELVLRWVNPDHGLTTILFLSLLNPRTITGPDRRYSFR